MAELEKALECKGMQVDMIIHDLRGPMQSVSHSLQQMEEKLEAIQVVLDQKKDLPLEECELSDLEPESHKCTQIFSRKMVKPLTSPLIKRKDSAC